MKKKLSFKRWREWIIELVILIAIVTVLSLYLSRNMLQVEAEVPMLELPRLVAGESAHTLESVQWDAADKTLIYFFAPWCSFCRVSMSGLSLLPEVEAQIVAVALDWESQENVSNFVKEVGFEKKVLLGNAATKAAFQIDAYPSYYVVDNQGQVVHKDRGFSTPPGVWLRLQ